jgi:hypothetical protein
VFGPSSVSRETTRVKDASPAHDPMSQPAVIMVRQTVMDVRAAAIIFIAAWMALSVPDAPTRPTTPHQLRLQAHRR